MHLIYTSQLCGHIHPCLTTSTLTEAQRGHCLPRAKHAPANQGPTYTREAFDIYQALTLFTNYICYSSVFNFIQDLRETVGVNALYIVNVFKSMEIYESF